MDLTVGTNIHGFTLRRVRDVPGTGAQLVEMVYEKTGTELVWYKTDEPNKLFNIIFKTLPQDSTGVFHILEHSILCGSEKYPLKEPFVELMKSTMNTFLNAITFRDKTMYPVASRNEQDFLNLTAVYLDAVFTPRAMVDEKIFLQEGWHHEIEADGLSYNGVVFNEMKGAMSAIDEVVDDGLHKLLFPDTSYGFNYGGDPAVIPELTYDHFRASYRRHYNPTNARIYLDGSVPLEKTLQMAAEYLSRFEPGEARQITYQQPRTAQLSVPCEAAPGDDLSAKGQVVLAKLLGTWADRPRAMAANVLCDVLCGSNDAPLKRAVLDAGLGQDVSMYLMDGMAQPMAVLRVHNTDHTRAAEIRQLVRKTLENLARTGLDREAVAASINALAFRLKDVSDPQALFRCLYALDSWLYGGDPMLYLTHDEAIAQLRQTAENGGLEALLRELWLQDDLSELLVVPSVTHGQETRSAEKSRLDADKAAMTAEALAALEARNETLHTWQQTPDSPEALATMPVLDLKEISPEPEWIPTIQETIGGITVLRHDVPTNGIVHLRACFSLADRTLEELTAASFLARLLGQLPTEKRSAAQVQTDIKLLFGSHEFSLEAFAPGGSTEQCLPCLTARVSVLRENLPAALELLADILTGTKPEEPQRIRQILPQVQTEAQQGAIMSGHSFAMTCALAHFSARAAAEEAASAYSFIHWLQEFEKDFDGRIGAFTALARDILANTVCDSRLTLSVTADFPTDLSAFCHALPAGTAAPASAAYTSSLPGKLGIRIPAQVSFACTGYQLRECAEPYRGTALLAANILSLSCLWNEVRVQGGAYGAGMQCDRAGNVSCYSYRDPSPDRSLNVYRRMADFLRAFRRSGESLDKYIISTIASTEPLRKPAGQGQAADTLYFEGTTREELTRERQQLLAATFEDLLSWCAMLEAMASDAALCVAGHEDALTACKEENLTVLSI